MEAQKEAEKEKQLPEAGITDSGYTITEIDESDVYPPKKTDENGNPRPAWLIDYAVRISNEEGESAMIRPEVTVEALDRDGNVVAKSTRTIRTYVLPGDEIAYASDMTVRGDRPETVRFYARSGDPEAFYPTQEELDMPATDSYEAGEVRVSVLEKYRDEAPSAGRKSSPGLAKGYYRFGELPELSGEVRCDSGEDQEAFVTILYRDGDRILGGETGRVMIRGNETAKYVLTAAAPIPEGTEGFEVCVFSIAEF